jgi:hypothetical protein
MTKEDQHIDETVQDTTLDDARESEDSSEDLDSLFDDDESQEDAPVSREEYNRLLKGTKKLATELGRIKSQKPEVKKDNHAETNSDKSDDVSELFFSTVPQAEAVQEDLRAVAESKYNGSIIKAWKGEKWLQDKAKALADEKHEDEANRSRIDRPASGSAGTGNLSFSKIDLGNKEHTKWLNAKPGRRAEYMDWYAKNNR